jgi:hypothetical protein
MFHISSAKCGVKEAICYIQTLGGVSANKELRAGSRTSKKPAVTAKRMGHTSPSRLLRLEHRPEAALSGTLSVACRQWNANLESGKNGYKLV